MSEPSLETQRWAITVLSMVPPKIRDSLIESSAFRRRYGLSVDATITFVGTDISISRTALYSAVRSLYSSETTHTDALLADGRTLRLAIEERGERNLIIGSLEGNSIVLPAYAVLSPNKQARLRDFDKETSERNLADDAISKWRERLQHSPLEDDEVDEFFKELKLNPIDVATAISNEAKLGESQVSVLVPRSRTYFERLVGRLEGIGNFDEYISERLSPRISELLLWRFRDGFAHSLLLAAHPTVSPLIDISDKDANEVAEFYRWLDAYGDRFSQVAGFEVGIGIIDRFPDIEPYLVNIATQIRDENPEDASGRLTLTVSLFIFVDGELSRIGFFRDAPPYWRRLAAIAQASLIERELVGLGVTSVEFAEWAAQGRGQHFYIQTLVDLRLEPRWLPDLIMPEQLKHEFISRLCMAVDRAKEKILSDASRRLLVDEGPESIRSLMKVPFSYLPGPLEGGATAQHQIPKEMVDELRNPSDAAVLNARFFAGIVNSSLIFRIEPEVAALVADVLRNIKYRVSLSSDTGSTFALLSGLATVAAGTRTSELAEEVRILMRVLQHRDGVDIPAVNQMRIGLIASAAAKDLGEWCDKVGDWFLEISYGNLSKEDGNILRSHLRTMCQIVPELWRSCAPADAAFSAIVGQPA